MIEFSNTFKTWPFKYDGQAYELREMTAAQRDRYIVQLTKRMTPTPDGKEVRITNFDGYQMALLSISVFNSEGKRVLEETLKEWPGTMTSALFAEAEKLNGINQSPPSGPEAEKKV